jgi:DnaJ-domain-containing protein 1
VIHARAAARGGPFRSVECRGCRTRVGLLHDARGRWLAYPLEGRDARSPLDWVHTRSEREVLERARSWWERNAPAVDAFVAEARDAGPPPGSDAPRPTPPPRPRATEPPRRKKRARRPTPPPPPPPPEEPAAPTPQPATTHRELLGVGPGATVAEIGKAYRAALKRCHPDRVASLDAEFQELAHRKAKRLRVAYEALLRDAPDTSGG